MGIAMIYASLGDNDKAFHWLEVGWQERSAWLPGVRVMPEFDSIRSDPRYATFLRTRLRHGWPPLDSSAEAVIRR